MNITRINDYHNPLFSQKILNQHGGFLVDGRPYEIEIISSFEAVVYGENRSVYPELIEEFRFYAPHITVFYDMNKQLLTKFSSCPILKIALKDIQPSQFYIDKQKLAAIDSFIEKETDIIIQVLKYGDRYISLDGHTRQYYAVQKGWEYVYAIVQRSEDCIFHFVAEAQKRGINAPYDMILLEHEEYIEKWDKFCDDFFLMYGDA